MKKNNMQIVAPKTVERKRAQRNRERLANHQCRLLDNFAAGVNSSYSDDNWLGLAKLFRQISAFLAPEECNVLGQLWRESYAEDVNPARVVHTVGLVKLRLASSSHLK